MSTNASTLALGILLLAAGTACSTQPPHDNTTASLSLNPEAHHRWHLNEVPILRLPPADDQKLDLTNVVGILRLSDGQVIVADGASNTISSVDRVGAVRWSAGRAGRGPGEFVDLWELQRIGDTIVALDARGVGQVFSPIGDYIRTTPRADVTPGVQAQLVGFLSNGIGIFYHTEGPEPSGKNSATAMLTLFGASGAVLSPIGRFPAFKRVPTVGGRQTSLVYGPEARIAALPEAICIGYSEEYTFECFDETGNSVGHGRKENIARQKVSEADRQIFYEGIDIANPGARGRPYRQQVRETTRFAEYLPAYGRFVASQANELWIGPVIVGESTLGDMNPISNDSTLWSVFSPEGQWLSDVALPPRFRLYEAGGDYVLGMSRNSSGGEYVVVFSLSR